MKLDTSVVLNPQPISHTSFSSSATIKTEVVSYFAWFSLQVKSEMIPTMRKLETHNNDILSLHSEAMRVIVIFLIPHSTPNDRSFLSPQVQSTSCNECLISPKINFSPTNDIGR